MGDDEVQYRPSLVGGPVVDRFGNLVTDMPAGVLRAPAIQSVRIAGRSVVGLSDSYQAAGGLGCVAGRRGSFEIFHTSGSAQRELGAGTGTQVHAALARAARGRISRG